jgi:CBS domain-containing protein
MNITAIMTRNPMTVSPQETLLNARDLMVSRGFRHLPVVEEGELVGILSDHDVNAHQARRGESLASSPGDTVKMAMTTPVHTAAPEEAVADAALRMAAIKIGCLPVVSRGALVGVLTITDILVAQSHEIQEREARSRTLAGCMTRDPRAAHSTNLLLDAAALMARHGIRHLPVIDAERRVIGMLSDRDVRTALGDAVLVLGARARRLAPEHLCVDDVMTRPVYCGSPDDDIRVAVSAFIDRQIGAMPIVDAEDRLIGIVSYVDVLRRWPDR